MKIETIMQKVFVLRQHYDYYEITMPHIMMRKKYRDAFIYRELEKMHPLFSNRFCCDTRFVLKNGKAVAQVVVMDRIRLAEYRTSHPRKNLFLEGKRRSVFSKELNARFLVPVCAAALFTGCILTAKYTDNQKRKPDGVKTGSQTPCTAAVLSAPEEVCAAVLAAVKKTNGKLASFKLQNGKCIFSLWGCHPEDIAKTESCVVSYQNGQPHFTIVISSADSIREPAVGENCKKTVMEFVPLLRKNLLSGGCTVASEQIYEDRADICFYAPYRMLSLGLRECASVAEDSGWSSRDLSVESNELSCTVRISFTTGRSGASVCRTLSAYSELFNSQQAAAKKNVPQKQERQVVHQPNSNKEKVGEIISENGMRLYYYRNSSGDMACMSYDEKGKASSYAN